MTLTDLLASAAYRDYLFALDAYLKKQPFKHEAQIEPVIVRVQEGGMGHVNIKADALLHLIGAERAQTFSYIAQKLAAYSEADGGPDNLVNLPATLHMPIGHLIQYLLLRDGVAGMKGYLKKIRVPNAIVYAGKITAMFRAAQATTE
ncbi:UNVERIFIED_ORG: hypothetical protein M2420_002929 [Stenotrophomonas maltophilia]